MVRDDPKLPDDDGGIPKSNEEIGCSIHGCEISSLHDGKLARSSTASCVLAWWLGLLKSKTFPK
jgi:hypothetical protein